MDMLKKVKEIIEAMDGLEVNFKIGKESELIIKGDFLTMAKLLAEICHAESEDNNRNNEIHQLQKRIEELRREGA